MSATDVADRIHPGTVGGRIIVAVDGTPRGDDAIAFARRLAEVAGAQLILAAAYPPGRHLDECEARDAAHDDVLTRLVRVRDRDAPGAAVTALANASPAHALRDLAEELDAALIAVGSARHGRARRVVPGTTGELLLHSAPCPVAVIPRGYAVSPLRPMLRIGVGVDRSPESAAALAAAVALAVALDAELEIVRAYCARGLPPDATLLADLSADARLQLAEAAATVGQGVSVHHILVLGSAASALAECSRDFDLLLVGSRGYRPVRSVALGGVSGRLIRRAACPVIVTPRGVANPFEALFSASCVSSSSRRSPA